MNIEDEPLSGEPVERIELPILDRCFKANPYPFYEALRGQGRTIVPVRLPTGVEAWLVTGHAEARELLNDPRLSKDERYRATPPHTPAITDQGSETHPLFRHLLTLDPPNHTRLRAIIAREFSSSRVNRLRPGIRDIALGLIDDLPDHGEADLIQAFALPLPLKVICALMGIPEADETLIKDWSARLAAADLDRPEEVPGIARALRDYLGKLAERKRAKPDDSLYSALTRARDRGDMTEDELCAMAFLLLSAGHETTTGLIGNGVVTLLRERGAWRSLSANGDLAGDTVEELLRLESPLEVSTVRYATEEIAVGGVRIRRGDRVFVGLAAANRDPGRYTAPNRFDIARKPKESHLAFGHGVHYCIGANLARAEGEIALVELTHRFPDLALSVPQEDLEWAPGLIMRGLRRLPVRLGPPRV